MVFKVSMKGVERVDISFASETLVELARRYRGSKGFCFIDLSDPDLIENWEAAAAKKGQPIMLWQGSVLRVIGADPSEGDRGLSHSRSRTKGPCRRVRREQRGHVHRERKHEVQATLRNQAFLLRRECVAESGGVEYDITGLADAFSLPVQRLQ